MTTYRTCWNCAADRSQCRTRARIRSAISGLHVTSVAFKCAERLPKFYPGERVSVTWKVIPDDWTHEDGFSFESWPATVSSEVDGKFVIRVDDVPSDHDTPAREYIRSANLYCKVSASKLSKLDEPDVPVCARCREIGGTGFAGCFDLDGDGNVPAWARPHPDCALAKEPKP